MNHLNELLMKPHGLYLCTHKSSIRFKISETLEGLSKTVKHTKWSSALTYDEMNIHIKRGE